MMKRVMRGLGLPLRLVLLALIHTYRGVLGPLLGQSCRFHPSCSAYAEEAINTHGALKGAALAAWRVLRCSPLSAGGPDPVPRAGAWRGAQYDSLIRPEGGD